jgi:hypothetical protein
MLRVDFDMEMDVVVDEVWAKEAEEFAGAVVAAVGGAIEFQWPMLKSKDAGTARCEVEADAGAPAGPTARAAGRARGFPRR